MSVRNRFGFITALCFLYFQIQQMMLENENLPDTEHLEQHEFNLDPEEQKRLEAVVDEEVSRVMHTQSPEALNISL